MRHTKLLLGLWVVGACASYGRFTVENSLSGDPDASTDNPIPASSSRDRLRSRRGLPQSPRVQNSGRDTYPINCHLHGWPSASVDSIKQAYSWFYQLATELQADAQSCRRIACFGFSAVWLCADSIASKQANSISIADEMNNLLDGNTGCLDDGNKSMVQGMIFTPAGWNVLLRGGEDCSVEPPEQGIFY